MKLSICFFAHNNQHYILKTLSELFKIDSNLKKEIKIYLLNDHTINPNIVNEIQRNCLVNEVEFENYNFQAENNYMSKASFMANLNSEFIMKIDEDIYLNAFGWENYLKDLSQVDWDINGLYAPLISNGIPSVELFLDCFFDENTKNYIRENFEKIKISNLWGAHYDHLVYDRNNYQNFFDLAKQINHVYKGIHPIRVSAELQKLMVDYVLCYDNWKKTFFSDNLKSMNAPYFCDSAFIVPTFEYKKIIENINNNIYFCDGFDEVALNQHLNKFNKSFLFNLNSPCIHPSYNTVGYSNPIIKNDFFKNIR